MRDALSVSLRPTAYLDSAVIKVKVDIGEFVLEGKVKMIYIVCRMQDELATVVYIGRWAMGVQKMSNHGGGETSRKG
jgi:hypothetical protein